MTSDKIIRVVAKHTNVSVSELMSKTRRRAVSQPRQIVHYFIRLFVKVNGLPLTLTQIAHMWEYMNTSNICHSVRTVNSLMKINKEYRLLIETIEREIKEDNPDINNEVFSILNDFKNDYLNIKDAHDKLLSIGCIFPYELTIKK